MSRPAGEVIVSYRCGEGHPADRRPQIAVVVGDELGGLQWYRKHPFYGLRDPAARQGQERRAAPRAITPGEPPSMQILGSSISPEQTLELVSADGVLAMPLTMVLSFGCREHGYFELSCAVVVADANASLKERKRPLVRLIGDEHRQPAERQSRTMPRPRSVS